MIRADSVRRKSLAQEEREKANIGDAPTPGISEHVVWEGGGPLSTTVAAQHANGERHMDKFCLTFQGSDGFWFIPTVPETRKWRGPFPNELHLNLAIMKELGDKVTVTRTKVNGPHKMNS